MPKGKNNHGLNNLLIHKHYLQIDDCALRNLHCFKLTCPSVLIMLLKLLVKNISVKKLEHL